MCCHVFLKITLYTNVLKIQCLAQKSGSLAKLGQMLKSNFMLGCVLSLRAQSSKQNILPMLLYNPLIF